MEDVLSYTDVLIALGSSLVVAGVYHLLVAGPALRKLGRSVDTHGELLGGGTSATARIDGIERRLGELEGTAAAHATRLDVLETVARSVVPRVGFVRYNAFDDVGSDLSYALALLTQDGDGVVLSSIYSREETRTYGKAVERFVTAQDASSEEKAAIARARAV